MTPKTILYTTLGILVLGITGLTLSNTTTWQLPQTQGNKTIDLKEGDTYTLTASYVTKRIGGKEQKMLAYNGSIPGPTLKIPQGAEITIDFKNATDLPAALHAHGVRMDNQYDGAPPLTQQEVAPGKSFTYKLKFPDVGAFWYHPHVHEVYEQPLGLYGAFIVMPTDLKYYPPVNREVPLFLSDIPMGNGSITLTANDDDHILMGHYGNIFLTNGQENFSLSANAGEVIRFYIVNAANARPFNIAIPGTQIKVIGSDSGAYEKAFFAENVTLGPSERAIIDVLFEKAGAYELQNKTPNKTYVLGAITTSTNTATTSYVIPFGTLQKNDAVEKSIAPFRQYLDKTPDKRLQFTIDMNGNMLSMPGMGHTGHMMPDGTRMGGSMTSQSEDGIEWDDTNSMMNQMSTTNSVQWKIVDQDTKKENMDIDWTLKKDTPVKIRIYNDSNSMHPMQHPIHFHGQRFLVVARDGVKQTNLVWKDTTLVKSGETVDIILDPSNPGTWMAHCHTAEHLQSGMMFTYKVE